VQSLTIESSTSERWAEEPHFLRIASVVRVTGLGRSTIYRLISADMFPCPVRLGPRAVAWRRSDVDRWTRHARRRISSSLGTASPSTDSALLDQSVVRDSNAREQNTMQQADGLESH
jgi:prophage regulatory protein